LSINRHERNQSKAVTNVAKNILIETSSPSSAFEARSSLRIPPRVSLFARLPVEEFIDGIDEGIAETGAWRVSDVHFELSLSVSRRRPWVEPLIIALNPWSG
jgi:hypothetical protein